MSQRFKIYLGRSSADKLSFIYFMITFLTDVLMSVNEVIIQGAHLTAGPLF